MKDISTTIPKEVKPEEPKNPVDVVNSTPRTEPLDKVEAQDRPFTAEYFDVPDWGSLLLEPKLDVNGLTSKISFIENFLSDQIKKNSMKVDKDSFRDILSDIENTLSLDSKHDLKYRISRVYGFLNVVKLTKEKEDYRRERLISMLKK